MKIEFLTILTININPWLAFSLIIALVVIYLINRGYDKCKDELKAKLEQGTRI